METKHPQDTESRHADKYIVRFPDGMRDQLKGAAKINNRTMNAEIVARLQASMATDGAIEQQAFERGFETTVLKREIERLSKLLEQRTTVVQPLGADYLQYLDEVLAKRDEKMRSWWEREFGYDPQAPRVERQQNKGPAPSSNARKKPAK